MIGCPLVIWKRALWLEKLGFVWRCTLCVTARFCHNKQPFLPKAIISDGLMGQPFVLTKHPQVNVPFDNQKCWLSSIQRSYTVDVLSYLPFSSIHCFNWCVPTASRFTPGGRSHSNKNVLFGNTNVSLSHLHWPLQCEKWETESMETLKTCMTLLWLCDLFLYLQCHVVSSFPYLLCQRRWGGQRGRTRKRNRKRETLACCRLTGHSELPVRRRRQGAGVAEAAPTEGAWRAQGGKYRCSSGVR